MSILLVLSNVCLGLGFQICRIYIIWNPVSWINLWYTLASTNQFQLKFFTQVKFMLHKVMVKGIYFGQRNKTHKNKYLSKKVCFLWVGLIKLRDTSYKCVSLNPCNTLQPPFFFLFFSLSYFPLPRVSPTSLKKIIIKRVAGAWDAVKNMLNKKMKRKKGKSDETWDM